MNRYQGQLYAKDQQGQKFSGGQNILQLMPEIDDIKNLKKVSIFAPEMTQIELNDETIVYIGSTGIYEIDDVQITSLKFLNDSSNETIIDYIIERK